MSVCYISKVLRLMEQSTSSITIADTTLYTNLTISTCQHIDKRDELLLSLYDTTNFSLECSYDIWRRNRINLLAWLQVKILFGLTWRLSHVRHKLLSSSKVYYLRQVHDQKLKLLFITLTQTAKYGILFFAITLWFDDIREWYSMPISTGILLTIYFCMH